LEALTAISQAKERKSLLSAVDDAIEVIFDEYVDEIEAKIIFNFVRMFDFLSVIYELV
jgi:hypothetical protein